MNHIFRPYLRKFVLVFLDNILVYSCDWKTHLTHLEHVLKTLSTTRFVVNKKKCSFGKTQVKYLGHVISKHGVSIDPHKVTSVQNWPIPHNVKGVRDFLGLTNYYRKFIHGYGKIAKPLTDLTKKDGFVGNGAATLAFEELKKVVTTAHVLALQDFSQVLEVECDASGQDLGAVLMQSGKPVAFYSKALSPSNLSKSIYEKELMAVVLAIQQW